MSAKRLLLWAACAACLVGKVRAADAILFLDQPGQTLYARVFTSSTASVAAALTEGTGNGAGRYVVTDATLAAAGLSGTAVYPFKVFVGTPSTSADDANVAVGSLRWASTAAVDPLPNAAAGASSGLSITSALTALSTLLGTPAGASVSADIAAVETQVGEIPTEDDMTTIIADAVTDLAHTSGGGQSFVAYIGSTDPNARIFDIVQGEAKMMTILVEANGTFADSTPTAITVRIQDKNAPTPTVITIENDDITRVLEDPNFQVIRFTVPADSSATLDPGLASIQIMFDDERVLLQNRIRILEAL